MQSLTIADTLVRTDSQGRYCLNDLHRAAGGDKRHQSANWLRLQQTRQLVAVLEAKSQERGLLRSEEAPVIVLNDGISNGTYVVKELVYAYAMWISAAFQIKVIRAYDALVTGRATPPGSNTDAQVAALKDALIAVQAKFIAAHEQLAARAPTGAQGWLFPPAAIWPETIAAFDTAVRALQREGRAINHARRPGQLAINLPEFRKLASQKGLALPHGPVLPLALGRHPQLIAANTAVNSVLQGRTVKCWVFAA